MPNINIRPIVFHDLDDIAKEIQGDRPEVGREFLSQSRKTFELLSEYPFMGRLCRFSKPSLSEIRRFPIKPQWPFMVFYRPIAGGVEIIRVIDERRDYSNVFQDRAE